ncbi:hypothetical protein WJX79_003403 [Trebouxia sp. C0005]
MRLGRKPQKKERIRCQHQMCLVNTPRFANRTLLCEHRASSIEIQQYQQFKPKLIALRSVQYMSEEMLHNLAAYVDFKSTVKVGDYIMSV